MNLTSDYPFWSVSNGLITTYPVLNRNISCDVAIVGGGITGALAGYHLAEAGVEVVLVDKRDIGTGSTSGSTGLLQYEVDVSLTQLVEKLGEQKANRSYQLCRESLLRLGALVGKLKIECDFAKKPSLFLGRFQQEIPEFQKEFKLRKKLGIPLSLWGPEKIKRHFGFKRPVALFSEDGGEVDPHRLTHGLLAAAARKGLKIFDRVKIEQFETHKRGMHLITDGGQVIRARRAIIAAGFESKAYLKKNAGRLRSTYALISEPGADLGGWYRRSLIWESGQPYLYLRTTLDKRIIVGGEDEEIVNPTRRDALILAKARQLQRKFGRLFPEIKLDVAYAWAGTFGETKDGLPYIGTPADRPHTYFALGYGGNGITYSLIAAEIIRDNFLGRKNPDAALFAFGR